MECRLKQSDTAWRSQVLLRPNKNGATEKPFGPVIYDIMELEKMLRRAQLAILNPHISSERFIELDANDKSSQLLTSPEQLKFSSDVVCIDVSGPHVPDLSFTDLPG